MTNSIPSLNGLRAICIFMVIGSHLQMHNYLSNNKALKYAGIILFNGGIGVNTFFIISGFLITKLLIDEQTNNRNISVKKFYLRRIIRIFPAYYLLLLVYILLQSQEYINISKVDFLVAITFTKQFFTSNSWEIDHLWSLSVEEVFYLLWPFVFIRFRNNIVSIGLVIIILVTIVRLVVSNFPVSPMGKMIFTSGDALLIGCLIAVSYKKLSFLVVNNKSYVYIAFLVFIGSPILYNYIYYLLSNLIGNENLNFFLLRIGNGFFGNKGLITNLSIGFIVIFSISVHSTWFWILNTPVMNHFGKLSYSIYLWQQLFTADREFLHNIPLIIILFLIYITAYLSYRFIEKPFMSLKRKFNLDVIPHSANKIHSET